MIITIAGLALSGKDTTAELLAEKTGFKLLKSTMKEFARKKNLDVLEFEKQYAEKTSQFDREMDEWQKRVVAEEKDCILTSQLSAVNIPNAELKVWLYAPVEERAKRAVNRDNKTPEESAEYVKSRDKEFRERVKKVYGIDWWDLKYYDLVINSAKFKPEQVVKIILSTIKTIQKR